MRRRAKKFSTLPCEEILYLSTLFSTRQVVLVDRRIRVRPPQCFGPNRSRRPVTNHTLFINSCLSSCTYCLVSDRRSAALNWEGVVPSHVRKARCASARSFSPSPSALCRGDQVQRRRRRRRLSTKAAFLPARGATQARSRIRPCSP